MSLQFGKLGSSVHNVHIALITENAVAFSARKLTNDAQALEMSKTLVDGGRGDPGLFHQPAGVCNGSLHHSAMHLQGAASGATDPADLVSILICQIKEFPRRSHGLGGCCDDRLGEKIEPSFPVPG